MYYCIHASYICQFFYAYIHYNLWSWPLQLSRIDCNRQESDWSIWFHTCMHWRAYRMCDEMNTRMTARYWRTYMRIFGSQWMKGWESSVWKLPRGSSNMSALLYVRWAHHSTALVLRVSLSPVMWKNKCVRCMAAYGCNKDETRGKIKRDKRKYILRELVRSN